MDQKSIGKKLRDLRIKMGFTTVTLAKKLGMSQAQISRLENGLQGFRSATLLKFSKVLGVPPLYFFVDGDVSTNRVATELEKQGLSATRSLRKALSNPAFLRFAEDCAEAFKSQKDNLARMKKAVKEVV